MIPVIFVQVAPLAMHHLSRANPMRDELVKDSDNPAMTGKIGREGIKE